MGQRIVLKGGSGAMYKEAQADAAITPGMSVMRKTNGNLQPCTDVGMGRHFIALENHWVGGGIDNAWAVNDQVVYQALESGAEFLAVVAAGAAAIAYGDHVEYAGDGTVRKATAGGQQATLTVGAGNGALKFTARLPGGEGNGITIQTVAAAGSGTVVVNNGDQIVVTPASAADTATAVIAQIQGNAVANELVTVALAAGSDGSASVGVHAATHLAGGTDDVFGPDSLVCRQATDNSAGASAVHMRVEIL